MRWGRQVVHVLVKDLRQQRWVVAVFLVTAGAATALATGWLGPQDPFAAGRFTGMVRMVPVLPLLAMLLAALVVQADSPTRSDAFWASRPLAPSAVMASKLLFLVLVLWLVPMVGQLLALLSKDVAPGRAVELLGRSGALQAGMLGAFALFAALTPDLRTFLVALVGGGIGLSMATGLLGLRFGAFFSLPFLSTSLAGSVTWLAVGLATLAFVYRSRNVRRAVAVAVVALFVGTAATRSDSAGAYAGIGTLDEIATDVRAGRLDARILELRPSGMPGREWWHVFVELELPDAPDGYRFRLVEPRAELTFDGGTSQPGGGQMTVDIVVPRVQVDGVTWVDDDRSFRMPRTGHGSFTIRAREAEAIESGDASLTISGLIEVARPWVMGSLPLEPGARVSDRDLSHRYLRRADRGGEPTMSTVREVVGGDGAWTRYSMADEEPATVLVNRALGEGVHLTASGRGNDQRPLVLPGASVLMTMFELSPMVRRGAEEPLTDAWLAGAEMIVHEWEVVGRYRTEVTIEARVRDPEALGLRVRAPPSR